MPSPGQWPADWALSGLRSGITWLSNKNVQFFFILLIFAFCFGPTSYICNLFTASIGEYITKFFSISLNTMPFQNSGMWAQNWDMYWWADWMAYAPLLGLFMVRVAYGRTIREFIAVEWVFPALFGIIWFAVFGGTILHAQLWDHINFWHIYQTQGADGFYVDEEACANDPDNGEPMAPRSKYKWLRKIGW